MNNAYVNDCIPNCDNEKNEFKSTLNILIENEQIDNNIIFKGNKPYIDNDVTTMTTKSRLAPCTWNSINENRNINSRQSRCRSPAKVSCLLLSFHSEFEV